MVSYIPVKQMCIALDNVRGISLREALYREWRQEDTFQPFQYFLKELNEDLYQECMTYVLLFGLNTDEEY